MTQPIIRALLESPLKAWAAAQSPVVPVAWENVEFTQPQGRYVRSNLLPIPTLSPDLGRLGRTYEGVYQITLCEPIGAGPGAAEAVITALIALYPPQTELVHPSLRLHILQPLSPAPPLPQRDRHVIPCSLPYRATVY